MRKLKLLGLAILIILVLIAYVPKVLTINIAGREDVDLKFAREHSKFVKPIRELYTTSHAKTDSDILQALGGQ